MKFLVFVTKWKEEHDTDPQEYGEKNRNFITKHTFKDLTHSIRGFVALVQYIEENIPHLTSCQELYHKMM